VGSDGHAQCEAEDRHEGPAPPPLTDGVTARVWIGQTVGNSP